jgi:hypothetical protein
MQCKNASRHGQESYRISRALPTSDSRCREYCPLGNCIKRCCSSSRSFRRTPALAPAAHARVPTFLAGLPAYGDRASCRCFRFSCVAHHVHACMREPRHTRWQTCSRSCALSMFAQPHLHRREHLQLDSRSKFQGSRLRRLTEQRHQLARLRQGTCMRRRQLPSNHVDASWRVRRGTKGGVDVCHRGAQALLVQRLYRGRWR